VRTITETLENALENTAGVKSIIRCVIEPSRIFFNAVTVNNPWSGADVTGILDEPTLQEVAYSATEELLITFLNDAGTLKYSRQGNATKNSLSLSITGKPGVHSSRLYRINGSSVYRHAINWAGPSLDGGTLINTLTETPLVTHGVSATRCAVLTNADGGLRPVVIDNTTLRESPSRFMFPSAIDYGDTRTMLSLATFSGAAQLGDKVFFYVSNCQKGWVEGIYWDSTNNHWSDIFIAVPTELQTSLCEFRVSNVYVHEEVIYLCGQFNRTDNIDDTSLPFTLLLYSTSGKVFALDRFTLVSELGYRFLATVGDGNLYLGNCNRVCHSPVVYTFNGTGTDHISLSIPGADINSYSDTSMSSARLELKAGDDVYAVHSYIIPGSRVKVYIGYVTTEGNEEILYNTYIIDSIGGQIRNGMRELSLSLMHEAQWKMRGLTMPFYTEIIGKSSVYDLGTQEGNLSVAPGSFGGRTKFTIDFWRSVAYTATGITGINLLWKGGVAPYTFTETHTSGFRTEEIKNVLNLNENPLITGTVVVELHGWSRSDDETNVNDEVRLLVVVTDEDGTNETDLIYAGAEGSEYRWENTYPGLEAGDYPIDVSVTGQEGKRIKYVGMIWHKAGASVSYASRIDITSGVSVEEIFDDPNTPWSLLDEGGYLLPSSSRPYMMFTLAPYNAWNFQLSAEFEISVEGGISGYPVSAGLVGLAQDGSNYILARYDKVTDQFELVVCRAGIETTLDYEAATVTVGDTLRILFEHHNGTFKIYAQESLIWVEQLSYDWVASDGWMFTSDIIAPRCGIYGYISVPSFRIVGLNLTGDDESEAVTEAVGMLPLEDISGFPDTGTIRIGDDLFTYDTKYEASVIGGPYQLRQNNLYAPPYGDGYGMEATHFNWLASSSVLAGYIIAIDAGHGFVNTSTLWQVFITTGGETVWLRNRCRYYSSLSAIGTNVYSSSNRVYATGGLKNIASASSSPSRHTLGETAFLELQGRIVCNWVAGSSGEEDTTVADLISRSVELAGSSVIFPGDQTSDEEIGSITLGTHDYPDGYDLYFDSPTVNNIQIDLGIGIVDYDPSYLGTRIWIKHAGAGSFTAELHALNLSTYDSELVEAKPFTASTDTHHYRILYHDNSISVYVDGRWIYTFAVEELSYPKELAVNLFTAITITNVRYVELCDWREAVYIDLETDASSALSSIIQERPVEMVPQSDGSVAFWYDKVRDEVQKAINPGQHSLSRPSALDASADSIIYATIDVGTVRDSDLAELVGFTTRVHRFSNLNRGAIRASKIIQQRKLEGLEMHEILTRIDPRIETGDIVIASFVASGTERSVTVRFIAESVSLNYNDKSMNISGRGYGI
jgi:molybdopterin-binding protein